MQSCSRKTSALAANERRILGLSDLIAGAELVNQISPRLFHERGGAKWPTGGMPSETMRRIIEFSPEAAWIGNIDPEKAKAAFESPGSREAATKMEKPPHPLMHRTGTGAARAGLFQMRRIRALADEAEAEHRGRHPECCPQ